MSQPPISTVSWALPHDWVRWKHGTPEQIHRSVAALGDDDRTTAAVTAAALKLEELTARQQPGTAFSAIWTPTPGFRKPMATAGLLVAVPPPEGPMNVERLLTYVRDAALSRGERVTDIAAAPGRVTAGDAVLRIVDTVSRFRRQLTREWTWFILPRGTDEMVACQVRADAVAHFDELADVSTDIANSVEVTLETT